ncbi:DEBR0S2_11672g1_1 [Brettanomyces bruxellensis]|uniref:DEBR0S2_11672g1_1 n=1 Tax=Dekkera bruxellensis TaxID=5007 RepID=A0A7D9CY83_DEKBR|nr:DEBR0S2_11672g1_1 [Brettanomyces bruxellensis]
MNQAKGNQFAAQASSNADREGKKQASRHRKIDAGPRKATVESCECLKKIVDLDTKSTTTALGVPEAVNNSAILKYRDLEGYINELEENCESVEQSDMQILKTNVQLDTLEKRVGNLEALTDQLDKWSSQLEKTTRKYRDDRRTKHRDSFW